MQEFSALGIVRSLSVGLALLLPILAEAQMKEKPVPKAGTKTLAANAPAAAKDKAAAAPAQASNAGQPMEAVIVHEFEPQIQQLMLLSAFEPDSKKIAT